MNNLLHISTAMYNAAEPQIIAALRGIDAMIWFFVNQGASALAAVGQQVVTAHRSAVCDDVKKTAQRAIDRVFAKPWSTNTVIPRTLSIATETTNDCINAAQSSDIRYAAAFAGLAAFAIAIATLGATVLLTLAGLAATAIAFLAPFGAILLKVIGEAALASTFFFGGIYAIQVALDWLHLQIGRIAKFVHGATETIEYFPEVEVPDAQVEQEAEPLIIHIAPKRKERFDTLVEHYANQFVINTFASLDDRIEALAATTSRGYCKKDVASYIHKQTDITPPSGYTKETKVSLIVLSIMATLATYEPSVFQWVKDQIS